MEESLASMNIS